MFTRWFKENCSRRIEKKRSAGEEDGDGKEGFYKKNSQKVLGRGM